MSKEPNAFEEVPNHGVNRRDFLKIAATAGVAASAAAMVTGCSSSETASTEAETSSEMTEEEIFNSYADPIAPVEVPEAWTEEADVIVVGTGAGGMTAALKLAKEGKSVILLEKSATTGGTSAEASILMNLGGHNYANEVEWAYPSYPYDPKSIVEYHMDKQGLGGDPTIHYTMAVEGPECIDWLIDEIGMPLVPMSTALSVYAAYLVYDGVITSDNLARSMSHLMDDYLNLVNDLGVSVYTSTPASALVMDGDRVVGVQATVDGEELYFQGSDGVILTAGGFAENRAMIKKYCPSVFRGVVSNYSTPGTNTGECVRMGLGAGADISGWNSASTYDGGLNYGQVGEYDQYYGFRWLFDGGNQACRQPWLTVDGMGRRVPYISAVLYPYANTAETNTLAEGLDETGGIQMTRWNAESFVCFDSKFEEYTEGNELFHVKLDRSLIDIPEDDPFVDRIPEEYRNWRTRFDQALEIGAIKQCDTIEELEAELGMKEGILVAAVDKWNAACAEGKDYVKTYPYEDEWMLALENPPYYGACLSAQIYNTKAGLMVNSDLEVINTDGDVIPGLYAGFHTAGGSGGENNICGRTHGGQYGAFGTSLVSGYIAAKSVLGESIAYYEE